MLYSRLTCCRSVAIGLATLSLTGVTSGQQPDPQEMVSLGLRGVYFVPNQGQWADDGVMYGLRSRGLDVAFRESSLTMHMTRENESTSRADASTSRAREEAVLDVQCDAPLADTRGSSGESAAYDRLTLTITFPGSNAVTPVGGNPQAPTFNYFVGGEGRTTASDVPSFGEVVYENLYDGVDLHVMGNDDGVLKYEFHVAPGADYAQIRIAYDGIESLCIDEAGNLQISTSFGTLADGAPVVWQEDSSSRADASTSPAHALTSRAREEAVLDVERDAPLAHTRGSSSRSRDTIQAHFELCDARTYRIALDGRVDPTRELIIDPDVEWMVYLGGGGYETGYDMTLDNNGNAYIIGDTNSVHFEGAINSHLDGEDFFLLKVGPAGQLLWMIYLCGNGDENGVGVATDAAGNAFATGWTTSTDVERSNNSAHGGVDAFMLKVSPEGQLLWFTYLGGSDDDWGYPYYGQGDIEVSSAGDIFVTGQTSSADFEGSINSNHGGVRDAFALRASASGDVEWMRYLGGSDVDCGSAITIDSAGDVSIAGRTRSEDFEGRTNSYNGLGTDDGFALKLDSTGNLLWMDYVGGRGYEEVFGIVADSYGHLILSGQTDSSDFFGRTNSFHGGSLDAFVTKLDSGGKLQWMTYVGGSDRDGARHIAVDAADYVLLAGATRSLDIEGRSNDHRGGYSDAMVASVDALGQIRWVQYLGGTDNDAAYGIALDGAGSALVSGGTWSMDFEGRINQNHNWGFEDAFLAKLSTDGRPELSVMASCPSGGRVEVSWFGATGGGQIALVFALNTGSFPIPGGNPCAGTVLGLGSQQLQVAYRGGAGANGSRTVNSNAGPGACGGHLQLLDVATCSTSNVVRIE